jgi:hypothetical protein
VVTDEGTKIVFRHSHTISLSVNGKKGVEVIAEYLIKAMGQKPGLSRQRFLGQFEVAKFERKAAQNGHPGSTFSEVTGNNLAGIFQD